MERSLQKKALLDEFITTKLHSDGVFLIRLISSNSGDTVTAALLKVIRPHSYSDNRYWRINYVILNCNFRNCGMISYLLEVVFHLHTQNHSF